MRAAVSGTAGTRERAARSALRSEMQGGKLGLRFSWVAEVGVVITCTIY